jgi:hypothetical protein
MLGKPPNKHPIETPRPLRNQPNPDGSHIRHLTTVFITFLALSIFDAIAGGALSAFLRIEGWVPLDQRINDVYQLVYGAIVAASLLWFYFKIRLIKPILTIGLLYLGYVEDTLFYLLIPLVNPVIKFITKGVAFELATGGLFPERISGWVGWIGRMFFGQNLSFDFNTVLVFNAFALVAIFLLWRKPRPQKPRPPLA